MSVDQRSKPARRFEVIIVVKGRDVGLPVGKSSYMNGQNCNENGIPNNLSMGMQYARYKITQTHTV